MGVACQKSLFRGCGWTEPGQHVTKQHKTHSVFEWLPIRAIDDSLELYYVHRQYRVCLTLVKDGAWRLESSMGG